MFCPLFTLTQIYKPILKSIKPKLAILFSLKMKNKMAVSSDLILCHSPKSLQLHLSTNLSETFRIDVNIDFAIMIFDLQLRLPKKLSPNNNLYTSCHNIPLLTRALCMQDTFARATHSAKRARDDRVSCIQARTRPLVYILVSVYHFSCA